MVRFTHVAAPLVVGALFLTGCPGDDVPQDTNGASSTGDMSTGPGPETTLPADDTTTTDEPPDPTTGGGVMCEPACGAGECCVEGLCFDAPEPVCEGGCAATESCLCPEGSDPCDCEASCVTCGVEEPSYDPCLDTECPAGSTCLADDPANPTFAVCAVTGCGGDACACPLPPGTGTAVNNCGDFGGTDACYLDCSDATCPDGMICRGIDGSSTCVWPGEGLESDCCFPHATAGCDDMTCQDAVCGADAFCCDTEWDQLCTDAVPSLCPGLCPVEGEIQPLYGDCINEGLVCDAAMGQQCLSDGASFGWCGIIGCMNDVDCEPAPATGTAPATCAAFNDGMGGTFNACALLCDMGEACPDGMSCFMDSFCVWNLIVPGYENCGVGGFVCPATTSCFDDDTGSGATWAYCGQDACADASECTFAATTGDAPVACADPTGMGGPNSCYLDCSAGQTCPDGMACTDSSFCAWPQGTTLLADDFETGDFSMGWTLNDVDGQTPNMNVSFVNAAWVVSDVVDGAGINQSATSTSWYEPVGQSDDWLISPQIMLGANSRVFWSSRTVDPDFPDGYEVRISTAGTAPADFTANAELFVVEADGTTYVQHFVDLAAAGYSNQQVYLAWRNVTNDGYLLSVDNVAVTDVP